MDQSISANLSSFTGLKKKKKTWQASFRKLRKDKMGPGSLNKSMPGKNSYMHKDNEDGDPSLEESRQKIRSMSMVI